MSIYKKLREATKKIKYTVRPMSQEDIEKSRKIGRGELMSDEEYESLGGDQADNTSNPANNSSKPQERK